MGKVGRPKKVEVKVEEKVEEPVIEEVLDDGMPVVTEKSAEVQEAETAKQPDINNPDDANKTYAEINEQAEKDSHL